MTATADLIDRLGKAALDCRAVIREAHEAIQGLREAAREADAAAARLKAAVRAETEAVIGERVLAGLEAMQDDIRRFVGEQHDHVIAEFDKYISDYRQRGGCCYPHGLYEWTCPSCGNVTEFTVGGVTR